jgi:hypothetical protein
MATRRRGNGSAQHQKTPRPATLCAASGACKSLRIKQRQYLCSQQRFAPQAVRFSNSLVELVTNQRELKNIVSLLKSLVSLSPAGH